MVISAGAVDEVTVGDGCGADFVSVVGLFGVAATGRLEALFRAGDCAMPLLEARRTIMITTVAKNFIETCSFKSEICVQTRAK